MWGQLRRNELRRGGGDGEGSWACERASVCGSEEKKRRGRRRRDAKMTRRGSSSSKGRWGASRCSMQRRRAARPSPLSRVACCADAERSAAGATSHLAARLPSGLPPWEHRSCRTTPVIFAPCFRLPGALILPKNVFMPHMGCSARVHAPATRAPQGGCRPNGTWGGDVATMWPTLEFRGWAHGRYTPCKRRLSTGV